MLSGRLHRSPFFLLPVLTILLGVNGVLLGRVSAETPRWGSGYYRVNPSKDRPFSSRSIWEEDRWYSDSSNDRNLRSREWEREKDRVWNRDREESRDREQSRGREQSRDRAWDRGRGRGRDENQNLPPRDLPYDFYLDTRRQGRPWGEIPPEWLAEEEERRSSRDRERSSRWRRPPRYSDPIDDGFWPAPDEDRSDMPRYDTWDYPYPPYRDDRYFDTFPYAPYDGGDRGRDRGIRRRDPYDYYYNGDNGWWDSP